MTIRPPPLLPKQLDYILSDARYTLYSGAFRAGKSVANIERLNRVATSKREPQRILFGMDTLASIKMQFIPKLITYLDRHYSRNYYEFNNKESTLIFTTNGSIVYFRGLEVPEVVQGDEFDHVIVEEATKKIPSRAWLLLYSRLSRPGSGFSATCNPGSKSHPIYVDYFTDGGQVNAGNRRVIQTSMTDNIFLDKNFVADQLRNPLWWRSIYIEGNWGSPEGLVYPQFQPETHVKNFDVDPSWTIFRGIDWGYDHPAACLYVGYDKKTDTFYVFDEIYERKLDPERLLNVIRRRENGRKVVRTLADPSRNDTIAWYNRQGMTVIHADNAVWDGIMSVTRYVNIRENGLPRLFVHENCREIAREFQSYEWSSEPDVPEKENDDLLDALRYVIHDIGKGINLDLAEVRYG